MPQGLIRSIDVAQHTIGPLSFFRAVRESAELKRQPGQEYWSWPQWEHFFALAEEHGMTACAQRVGGAGKTITELHFTALGTAMLALWRRVRKAQADTVSSYGFHLSEQKRWAAERAHLLEMEMYQQNRVRENLAPAPSGRRGSAQGATF